MGTTRQSCRLVYWEGVKGPDRRYRPKRAFELVICTPRSYVKERTCRARFFAGRRGLA